MPVPARVVGAARVAGQVAEAVSPVERARAWWQRDGAGRRAARDVCRHPADAAHRAHAACEVVTGRPDDEVADRTDHEEQAEQVADEARHADQHPAGEDDEPVEELPRRHLATEQPLAGMREDTEAGSPDGHRSEGGGDQEEHDCEEHADLACHGNERGDLDGDGDEHTEQEHSRG